MVDDSQQHDDSKQGKTSSNNCSTSSLEQPVTISGSSTKRKRTSSTIVSAAAAAAAAEVKDPQSGNDIKTTILKDNNDGNNKTRTTGSSSSSSGKNDPPNTLQEPGAWKCPSCENQNFASRHKCRSATCNTKRPLGVFVPPKFKSGDGDGEKKESTKWPAQAGEERIQHNEYLRKRYLETMGGESGDAGASSEGMSEEDIARAKLLIERDERKKLQKEVKNKNKALKKKNKENNRNNKKRKPNEDAI